MCLQQFETLAEFLIKADKTSVASPHCFMQTIAPCILLICLQNTSVALSICCNMRIKIGFWSWVKIVFKLWEHKLASMTQLSLKCYMQRDVHTSSNLNKWKQKEQEVLKTWKGNYSSCFQLALISCVRCFLLLQYSANVPLSVCPCSIQSNINTVGILYFWAVRSWQFQFSQLHWLQWTHPSLNAPTPTADTLATVKLQGSFSSSPTSCLATWNAALWSTAVIWTAKHTDSSLILPNILP